MEDNSTVRNEIKDLISEISQYYLLILMILGVLGNSLSMCVFFCTKLRYSSSSIYLGTLAISDTGFLITEYLVEIIKNYQVTNFLYIPNQTCYVLSVWIVMAFTIERYVAIQWPLRRQSLCTVARAKIVVIGLAGLASALFILLKLLQEFFPPDNGIIIIIYFIASFLMPFSTILIFNMLIVRKIYKQNRIRKNLIVESNISKRIHISSNGTPQTKTTKMLILISSVLICLNTPKGICMLMFHFDAYPNFMVEYHIYYLIISLDRTNYGINFILYCVSGQNFRRALTHMFTKCLKTETVETVEMANKK